MRRIKGIIILLTILLPFHLVLHGKDDKEGRFASRKVHQLYELMSISSMPESDTIKDVPGIDRDVSFIFNRNHQLSHIGLSLFDPGTKQMFGKDMCNFLERFFLELLLQESMAGVRKKLEETDVRLTFCGLSFGEGNFTSIKDVLHVTDKPTDFAITGKGEKGYAAWTSGGKSLKVEFPLQRELIEGTDKKESDEIIYELLKTSSSGEADMSQMQAIPDNIQKLQTGIYVSKGIVGQVQELTSDRYYTMKGQSYSPLFDIRFPEFSMNNLFLTSEYGKGKTLQITHRQYNHVMPEIIIPLNNFLECFHEDFQITCHTAFNKKGELETIVVLQHMTLNYIHTMRAHIAKDDLFGASPVIKADFYTNIPQHYIKTLLQ